VIGCAETGIETLMVVLVTGATGLLGRAIARSYLAEGRKVHLVGRDAEKLRRLYGDRAAIFAWGQVADEFPVQALEGVSTAFHLMGEPVGGRWTKAKKARIITSRVTSAQMLATAIGGGPVRLISASSFGIYPGRRGEIYDEETRIEAPGQSFIQSTLRAWENAALSAGNGSAKVTIIRFGLVCGPEGYPKKLARLCQRVGGLIAGDGDRLVPIVDIDDAVAMMRWAADGNAGDGVINCVSPEPPRFRDVAETIAAVVGKPIRFKVPDWLARPILGGSADYFLLSYDIRSARALAQGFRFAQDDPKTILRRALKPYIVT
jgi:uncharacterized protein (TIGR01777 family)